MINLEALNINGSIIDTHFQLVTKSHEKIYAQSSLCDICESSNPVNDECIFNMLTHMPPKCHTIRHKNTPRIKEIKKGIVLIDTNEDILITDSCGEKRVVNSPTIAEITNCTVTILDQTFSYAPQITFKTEYLAPLYAKMFQQPNLMKSNS
uniref:Uncharacterized protein n=1 Tax=Anopheles culicifacies TaxID=139723 RepID=A0A182MN17_9DIPT